jgi:hypothetical protein
MTWQAYKIVLRLRSPLHVGQGKVGNLQRTRPYVAGRNLWGALTARLTRDMDKDTAGKPAPHKYTDVGELVQRELAFTYLYPTEDKTGKVALWPWDNDFRYRFLSTYAGTALNYAATSAEEASLHEVECIVPHTRDEGNPVYLSGYLFQHKDSDLDWQGALDRMQIGGERGYGWGDVRKEEIRKLGSGSVPLFDMNHIAHLNGSMVKVELAADQPLLAHALATDFNNDHRAISVGMQGSVEPLVGRETTPESRFGVQLSAARICYAPGAGISEPGEAVIEAYGVWEGVA